MTNQSERRAFFGVKTIGLLALFILLSACAAPVPSVTLSPISTTTQSIIPTPVQTPVYTEVLRSPDGAIRGNVVCYQGYMQWNCQTHFPNGNVLYGAPGSNDWSPDDLYAVVCMGATHDSPCSGFQVWDMLNGTVKYHLYTYTHKWSPVQKHALVYLVENHVEGIPDDLIEFDPAANDETVLQECPAWFFPDILRPCPASPGVVVGGKVTGLPRSGLATIRTYALDEGGVLCGWQSVEQDGGSWQQLLRKSFGKSFRITLAEYVSNPTIYDLYVDGTQVYTLKNGQRELIQPNSIDFVLEKK